MCNDTSLESTNPDVTFSKAPTHQEGLLIPKPQVAGMWQGLHPPRALEYPAALRLPYFPHAKCFLLGCWWWFALAAQDGCWQAVGAPAGAHGVGTAPRDASRSTPCAKQHHGVRGEESFVVPQLTQLRAARAGTARRSFRDVFVTSEHSRDAPACGRLGEELASRLLRGWVSHSSSSPSSARRRRKARW